MSEGRQSNIVDIDAIRAKLAAGIERDAHSERATAWKILLGYLPQARDEWEPMLCNKRTMYQIYRDEHPMPASAWKSEPSESDDVQAAQRQSSATTNKKASEESNALLAFDLPSPPGVSGAAEAANEENDDDDEDKVATRAALGANGGGETASERKKRASDALVAIEADVPRTMSAASFFYSSTGEPTEHAHAARRILFLYVSLNSGVHYTSGMNEILAQVYRVFVLADEPEHAEADAFWCFTTLLSEMHAQRLAPGDVAGWCVRLMQMIETRDPPLHALLSDEQIDLSATYSWFCTIMAFDFGYDEVPLIWDVVLADAERFEVLLLVAYAIISLMRTALFLSDSVEERYAVLNAPRAVGVGNVLQMTRQLLKSRGSLRETVTRMQATARDRLTALSQTARSKLRSLSNAPAFQKFRGAADKDGESGDADERPDAAGADADRNANVDEEARDAKIDAAASAIDAMLAEPTQDISAPVTGSAPRRTWARRTDASRSPPPPNLSSLTTEMGSIATAITSFELPDVPKGPPGAALRARSDLHVSDVSGWAERQGRRPTMEDAETVVDDVLKTHPELASAIGVSRAAFYGVYDGHAGALAAEFVAEHLLDVVVADLIESKAVSDEQRLASLARAFKRCDEQLLETSVAQGWTDGSTAVVTMLLDNKVYVANCGDAESVVARRDADNALVAECITIKHKPNDEAERVRIQEAGGCVIFGRVGGTLAVSRAFGDRPFKAPHSKTDGDLVSVEPYTCVYPLDETHEFLLVACDGLYDVFEYQDLVDFAANVKQSGASPSDMANQLTDAALDRRSLDNVTCIVVFLDKKPLVANQTVADEEEAEKVEDETLLESQVAAEPPSATAALVKVKEETTHEHEPSEEEPTPEQQRDEDAAKVDDEEQEKEEQAEKDEEEEEAEHDATVAESSDAAGSSAEGK